MSEADASPPPIAVEARRAAIAASVLAILKTLRSPRIRGPFPYPTADLARSAYLHELATWARAAALRSRRTLGSRGVEQTLAAAERLAHAADLLARLESEPGLELAPAIMAEAALASPLTPRRERD
jgi:hypothetical protein